jgi:3-oxoacyl-[acyl-carrier protein] reductase
MNLGLESKTALITAASGGIGSGIARALADGGAVRRV